MKFNFKFSLFLGVLLLIIHLFYTINNNYKEDYKIVPYSTYVDVDTEISYTKFEKYNKEYQKLLKQHFNKDILYNLKEITLCNFTQFSDGSVGNTVFFNNNDAVIIIAINHKNHKNTLFHEITHILYKNNKELFDKKYKKEWLKINDYVTQYAKTSLTEDIAETGAIYYCKTQSDNKKIKLFKQFINDIWKQEK